jgi:hypothetical protein
MEARFSSGGLGAGLTDRGLSRGAIAAREAEAGGAEGKRTSLPNRRACR